MFAETKARKVIFFCRGGQSKSIVQLCVTRSNRGDLNFFYIIDLSQVYFVTRLKFYGIPKIKKIKIQATAGLITLVPVRLA